MRTAQDADDVTAFMYLGRFGALGQFSVELADAVRAEAPNAVFIVSAQSGLAERVAARGVRVCTVPTFERPDPASLALGYIAARRALKAHLQTYRPRRLVNLMPHVFSPLLVPAIRRQGTTFATIVHDAVPHPGDRTARVTRWLLREARQADTAVTLSNAVATALVRQNLAEKERVHVLFHPDLNYASALCMRVPRGDGPLRLLFLGRIMAYKGLDLLAGAVAHLKAAGIPVRLGVAGSGTIPPALQAQLRALDAEVINRWIADEEISPLLARYDAVACSHREASQSGVASTAFGHGLPVVAMPVGGIVEQVIDGETGILAQGVSAQELADAIARLATSPGLTEEMSAKIFAGAPGRSMARFAAQLCAL